VPLLAHLSAQGRLVLFFDGIFLDVGSGKRGIELDCVPDDRGVRGVPV